VDQRLVATVAPVVADPWLQCKDMVESFGVIGLVNVFFLQYRLTYVTAMNNFADECSPNFE